MDNVEKIYDLLNSIQITKENALYVEEIKELLAKENYLEALKKMKQLKENEQKDEDYNEVEVEESEENDGKYPKQLSNPELENIFIGLLLENILI